MIEVLSETVMQAICDSQKICFYDSKIESFDSAITCYDSKIGNYSAIITVRGQLAATVAEIEKLTSTKNFSLGLNINGIILILIYDNDQQLLSDQLLSSQSTPIQPSQLLLAQVQPSPNFNDQLLPQLSPNEQLLPQPSPTDQLLPSSTDLVQVLSPQASPSNLLIGQMLTPQQSSSSDQLLLPQQSTVIVTTIPVSKSQVTVVSSVINVVVTITVTVVVVTLSAAVLLPLVLIQYIKW